MLDLARQLFHSHTVVPVRPNCPDVGAHAATSDDVHFDTVLLQHLNNADVSKASRSTRGERQTDSPVPVQGGIDQPPQGAETPRSGARP